MKLEAQAYGISPATSLELKRLFERTPKLERVWVFGSRATGKADIDLAFDAPTMSAEEVAALLRALANLPTLYKIDAIHWQGVSQEIFRAEIERDRALFWEPRRHIAGVTSLGSLTLKKFQTEVLDSVARYIEELRKHEAKSIANLTTLRAMEGMEDAARDAADFPKKTWAVLKAAGALPAAFAAHPHSSRFDGAGRAIPNVCLKVPTGGGKTLLAAACVSRVYTSYLKRHTGLVLWVVPNEAIYRQTLKSLSDRDHPYRQMLNVAGAGRVKILEKGSPLSRLDTDSHLCVMLLMLQSAARQSKETLRFFRDRGNVLGFLPREDDIEAHWALLEAVPNLDAYSSWGTSSEEARAQKGSIVKSSLGNVMRLLRPMVVIDEGQHAYTENALRTLDGFNPSFMLELSATPRIGSAKGPGSNILVDVRGTDLDEAEMIKLPIHVDVKAWSDWQSCLGAAVHRLTELADEAGRMQAETARYLRPILLVQVERTGADLRDSGYIHAEDAKAHLMQLGFNESQVAIKTSEKNELKQPENIDLLSPSCEVRAIITKQALQEGWDCPFAYVLCALAAGRNTAAMTQLVGRILRQPQTAKTGRAALDACYVLCNDAKTADVVKAIKKSLETEGMGDLALAVSGKSGEASPVRTVHQHRRPSFAALRLFLPRVTWVEHDEQRRELVYDSDVLARLPWHEFDAESLAHDWAPDAQGGRQQHMEIDLSILQRGRSQAVVASAAADARLDRAQLVRSLIDLAPNAWLLWAWIERVVARLASLGYRESQLAASSASLVERLRIDIEAERDRLAQQVFEGLVAEGRVEFRLRADLTDYELPHDAQFDVSGVPQHLIRPDGHAVEKSLLEPIFKLSSDNNFETDFACYLDEKAALVWWHRNVAKAQYGLQGWKRNKIYPDFVFARMTVEGHSQMVVMETKGLHLAGSTDTKYKRALLDRLSTAYKDERAAVVGKLSLDGRADNIICDLVFDAAWRGTLESRYFHEAGSSS